MHDSPCLHRREAQPPTSRSNRTTSQKRVILHKAAGYALTWAVVQIHFMIINFLHESHATLILNACLTPLQGLFNFLVLMSPKVRNTKRPRRGENLTWYQAFIKAFTSRGERRKTGRDSSSRTGSRLSLMPRVKRSLKSLLLRTSPCDTRSNESNAHITTNNQSSNPRQVGAPADKLTSSNPHLADDIKEAEGNNATRPQQREEFLAMDGDDRGEM